jgi:hypothetical protein
MVLSQLRRTRSYGRIEAEGHSSAAKGRFEIAQAKG